MLRSRCLRNPALLPPVLLLKIKLGYNTKGDDDEGEMPVFCLDEMR